MLEEDEALSFLLATALELHGYDVEVVENAQSVAILLSASMCFNPISSPAVVVLDAGSVETMLGLDVCRTLKKNDNFANTKFILTSIFHDKELVLNSGADLYLPKPYELSTLMSWVKIFVKEVNA